MKKPALTNEELLFSVNRQLFSPLVITTFAVLMIETLVYPGFLLKTFALPPEIFVIASVLSSIGILVEKLVFSRELSQETLLTLRLNFVTFPCLLFISALLNQLERSHFDNYVFSTFHVHLAYLDRVVGFSTILVILFIIYRLDQMNFSMFKVFKSSSLEGKKFSVKTVKQTHGALIFVAAICFMVLFQVREISQIVISDVIDIARHPLATMEERRYEKFQRPYYTYKFFAKHIEPDSIVAVAPQSDWWIVGNIGFSRYFLYPRFLIHLEDYTPETMPDIDYYIIGENPAITQHDVGKMFPAKPMPAESIYIFDELSLEEKQLDLKYYDPANPVFKGKWGILKVVKNQGQQ